MKKDLQSTLLWGLAALAIANLLGSGLSPLFIKLGIREIPPLVFTALRFILAAIIFLPFYLRQISKKLSLKDFLLLSLQSIFFAGNVGFFSIGIQFTSAIMSQTLYTFLPIFVGVLSYFTLKERFSKAKIIGSAVALLGVSFLIQQSILKADILSLGTLLGNVIVLCAVMSYSGYITLSQKLTKIYSPVTTSFFNFAITAILLTAIIPFELTINPIILNKITIIGIVSLLGVSIFGSAISFFLVQVGIKKTSAFTASLFQYTGPLSAAITAIPILGEKPTFSMVAGGILIIIGVFYATTWQYIKKQRKSVLQ